MIPIEVGYEFLFEPKFCAMNAMIHSMTLHCIEFIFPASNSNNENLIKKNPQMKHIFALK